MAKDKEKKKVAFAYPPELEKHVGEGFVPLDPTESAVEMPSTSGKGPEMWLVQIPAGADWSELDGLEWELETGTEGMLGRITLPDGQAMEAMVEGRALSAGLLAVRPAGEGEAAGPVPIGKRVTLVPRRQAPDALVGEFGQRGTEGLATLSAEIERLAQGGGGAGPTRALNTAAITPAKEKKEHKEKKDKSAKKEEKSEKKKHDREEKDAEKSAKKAKKDKKKD